MRLRRRRRPERLTFVTRDGCTLCAEALPVVQRLAADAGVPVEVRDVDADPADRHWSDHVPVVLLDGRAHSYWFVDPAVLRAALRGRPTPWVSEAGAARPGPGARPGDGPAPRGR